MLIKKCSKPGVTLFIRMGLTFTIMLLLSAACSKDSQFQSTTGKGGSMARFTITGNNLYVVDDRNLKVFDISVPDNPVYIKEIYVGISIETIFPHHNKLFIGSRNGMYIYNITNPSDPQFVAEMTHIISCDPVVVNDSLAFVTLRSGGDCRTSSNVNQLEIIDISDPANPVMRATHPMSTPYGLGTDSNLIFICHGKSGLGIYDFMKIDTLDNITTIENIETFDVIPYQKILYVIGPTGLYQYSYANPDSVYLLSHIANEQ